MSASNRSVRWLAIALAILWAQAASADGQQFQLVKTGTTGATDSIRFTGVACDKLIATVPTANAVINGDNLYTPDLLRVDESWYCYHGGFLTSSKSSDRIYLGISSTSNPAGSYSPASQLILSNGTYKHVNDHLVVQAADGTWPMLYMAARYHGGDWIAYSTSSDGINWSSPQEIVVSDPQNLSGWRAAVGSGLLVRRRGRPVAIGGDSRARQPRSC